MMEPLFGYDLVNGELVENHIEADFVRFQFALEIGQKPEPPRHMVQSIKKYHNNEITDAEAKKKAYDLKYITMYFRALCKAKHKELQRAAAESGTWPPKTPRVAKKTKRRVNGAIEGAEATNANVAPPVETKSEPIIPRDLFEAVQAKLLEAKAEEAEEPETRWYSTAEICEHLGITRNTLMQWIVRKGLPGYKIVREWRFKPAEVDAWLNGPGEKELSYQRLFTILKDRGWTKKQFAVMAGLSQATVTKMTVDGAAVNTNVLDKICTTLGCKIGDIVQMVPVDKEWQ